MQSEKIVLICGNVDYFVMIKQNLGYKSVRDAEFISPHLNQENHTAKYYFSQEI